MQELLSGVQRVFTKARTHMGTAYPAKETEFLVKIVRNESIQIFKEKSGQIQVGRTFVLDDEAEYDSYNLRYLGLVTSITDKSVTICKTRGANVKKHRLDLYDFCMRNFDLNVQQVKAENSETMMYI